MADWPYSTSTWQRLRRAHLAIEPTCRMCWSLEHRFVMADVVDHIVPISKGGPAFPDHAGLQSLCAPCHARKGARGPEAGAVKTHKPIRGCDANGWPLDPLHPWNVQEAGREDE
jgi:5-methylcytosine-specific restriction protein A